MTSYLKKGLSFLLIVLLLVGLVPITASAEAPTLIAFQEGKLAEKLAADEALWDNEEKWMGADWVESAETTAADSGTMTITAATRNGVAGMPVKVKLRLTNNPGIASIGVTVAYDSFLTLGSVEFNSAIGGDGIASSDLSSPVRLIWHRGLENYYEDAVFATLNFTVAETALVGETANVRVYFNKADIQNAEEENVTTAAVNGTVTVIPAVAGDVNGDGRVTNGDITRLFQIRAQWDVDYNEGAVDVNGDGRVTNGDITRLFQYRANWPVDVYFNGVVQAECQHENMQHFSAKTAPCGEQSNIEYWYCGTCGKYFMEAAGVTEIEREDIFYYSEHTLIHVPAKEPTTSEDGNYEYWHCTVCGKYFRDAEATLESTLDELTRPKIVENLYNIEYRLVEYNVNLGDTYIAQQFIENSNPAYYSASDSFILESPSLSGYAFDGWYLANGTRISEITPGLNTNLVLFAHWHEIEYNITYVTYRTPLTGSNDNQNTYTVSKGNRNLWDPEINNYVFLGWYTDDGQEVTEIPVGTVGDLTLNAYWTSQRNMAKAKANVGDPIIVESTDSGVIYFIYEIGTIENIPLSAPIWEVQSVAGLTQQQSVTYQTTITQTQADTISKSISNATVDSSTWSLSEEWDSITQVNEAWAVQHGMQQQEADQMARTETGTYSVTNSRGGSSTVTDNTGTTALSYASGNIEKETGSNFDVNVNAEYSNSLEVSASAKANVGVAEVSGGVKDTSTFKISGGVEYGNYDKNKTNVHAGTDTTTLNTHVDTSTSNWNSASTSTQTTQASTSRTTSQVVSDVISKNYGYGSSYSNGGESGTTQGKSTTQSTSVNSSSTLTFSTTEINTVTKTYTADGHIEGKYRLVLAGTAHVFAVVGYDVGSSSYFLYTYSVMDDTTYEFLDYTPKGYNFDDYEFGALPFEVPYSVYEYVNQETVRTEGLGFETDSINKTAIVTSYSGTDTDVIIPTYYSEDGIAYRVTGIESNAFSGKNIRSIELSEFIDEISSGAFKNCTQLEQVSGCFTKIGSEAFSGCVSLESFNLSENTTYVGQNAFAGVGQVTAIVFSNRSAVAEAYMTLRNQKLDQLQELGLGEEIIITDEELYSLAAQIASERTQNVINNLMDSGASRLIADISSTYDGLTLTFNVPAIEYFELRGGLRTYTDLKVSSAAGETVLKELIISDCTRTPLEMSSSKLTIHKVFVYSNGYALLLNVDAPIITLKQDNLLSSQSGNAIVWMNPILRSEKVGNTNGYINVSGNVYYYGTISGDSLLRVSNGSIIQLNTIEEFNSYVRGAFTVFFNPNGGIVNITSKTVYFGQAFGELPAPTRDRYTFDGWYTEATGGTAVTASTVFSTGNDVTIYAHWSEIYVTKIEVATNPTTTSYFAGDTFSVAGMTIKATYNDSTVETHTASECTVSTPNMTATGTKTVTVSYGGKSTTFNITVNALTISLSANTSTGASGYIQLSASVPRGTVSWASSNGNVATVDSSGQVTFMKNVGTAVITATVNNNGVTNSASKTVTVSNSQGTKFGETSSSTTGTVLYGTHPGGYSTSLPVTTGSIPGYTTNAADVTNSSTNTSTGRVDVSYTNHGVDGYVYYQFNYNSSTGGDNIYKIINFEPTYRNCYINDGSTPSYAFYESFGRQFYSSTDYPEAEAKQNWTAYTAYWWAYRDKQAGHTWYTAKSISGALAASWYRFPLTKYTKTTTTYTYYFFAIS